MSLEIIFLEYAPIVRLFREYYAKIELSLSNLQSEVLENKGLIGTIYPILDPS